MNVASVGEEPKPVFWKSLRALPNLSAPGRLSDVRVAQWLFVGVFLFLCCCQGARLVIGAGNQDSVLEASRRMLSGQRLYVDFFSFIAPGSCWIHELAFRIFGLNLLAGRLPVLFETALQGALVFCLARSFVSRRGALTCSALFLWLQIWNANALMAEPRWDGGTFALAAVFCAWRARHAASSWPLFLSGCMAAAALVCTPSAVLAAVAILVWILFEPAVRRRLLAWVLGVALVLDAALVVLGRAGELGGFFNHIFWLKMHSSANSTLSYGSVAGGYSSVLGDAAGLEFFVRCFMALWIALPAVCPIIGIAAGLARMLRHTDPARKSMAALLTLSAAALVASVLPRMDVENLAFVLAIPFVLSFAAIAALPNRHVRRGVLALCCLCSLLALPHWFASLSGNTVPTPAGKVRVGAADSAAVFALLDVVHPGDTVYVHSCAPLLYVLTEGRNPAPFSCLAPGATTTVDVIQLVDALNRHSPKWVLEAADPAQARYPRLDYWITQRYRPTGLVVMGFRLLRHVP